MRFFRQLRLVKRRIHELHPAVARGLINHERSMSHPQSWMSAALDIALRSAKAKDKEISQPFFSARQVLLRIHRAQNVVIRNTAVEGRDKPREAFLADD